MRVRHPLLNDYGPVDVKSISLTFELVDGETITVPYLRNLDQAQSVDFENQPHFVQVDPVNGVWALISDKLVISVDYGPKGILP